MSQLFPSLNSVTAHDAIDLVITRLSQISGLPIIFDPGMDYERCVEHYRVQMRKRNTKQNIEDVRPSIIAWDRGPMQMLEQLQRRPTQGGNEVRVTFRDKDDLILQSTKGQIELRFRVYSSDIRVIDDIEVAYLSGYLMRDMIHFPYRYDPIDDDIDYQVEWKPEITEFENVRDGNQYVTTGFRGVLSGNFFIEDIRERAADFKRGIGTDGNLKDTRNVNFLRDVSIDPLPSDS